MKHELEQEEIIKGLILDLRTSLSFVGACHDLQAIEKAADNVKSLTRLVARAVALIDEYMRPNIFGKRVVLIF